MWSSVVWRQSHHHRLIQSETDELDVAAQTLAQTSHLVPPITVCIIDQSVTRELTAGTVVVVLVATDSASVTGPDLDGVCGQLVEVGPFREPYVL